MQAKELKPTIQSFFDKATWTFTYIVHQGPESPCAIIDSVLNYDPKSGRTQTTSADLVIQYVKEHQLKVEWILETHAHADHVSAAPYFKKQLGGKIGIGHNIIQVQKVFKRVFHLEPEFKLDGSQFDILMHPNEDFKIGNLTAKVLYVPGHTPACVAYQIADAVFVGDTLFMPDVGTARCDFPGGDASTLYKSIQQLLSLPVQTRLFMCHDYPPTDRPIAYETTVADQKSKNIHVHDGITENQFVDMRSKRDATLEMPVLILPSVQINIRAGEMPPKETNGTAYLKIPINAL